MVRLRSKLIYAIVQVIAVTVLTSLRCTTQHSDPVIKLSLGPENSFLPGETARFNCTVENAKLYTVSLRQYKTCLTYNHYSSNADLSITTSQDFFSFEIRNIRERYDANYYCCVLENPDACTRPLLCSSDEVRLEVYPPPADPVCSQKVSTNVHEGQELQINCTVGTSRPDPTVFWKIKPDGGASQGVLAKQEDTIGCDALTEQTDTIRCDTSVTVSRRLNGRNLTCTSIWAVPRKNQHVRVRECHLGPFSVTFLPTSTIPLKFKQTLEVDIKTTNKVVSMNNSTGLIQTGHVTEIMEVTTDINMTELYTFSILQTNTTTAKIPPGQLELALKIGLSLLIAILVLVIVLLIRKILVDRRRGRETQRDYWTDRKDMSVAGNRPISMWSDRSTESGPTVVMLRPRQQFVPAATETKSSFKSNTLQSIPESMTYDEPAQVIRHTYLGEKYPDEHYPPQFNDVDGMDSHEHYPSQFNGVDGMNLHEHYPSQFHGVDDMDLPEHYPSQFNEVDGMIPHEQYPSRFIEDEDMDHYLPTDSPDSYSPPGANSNYMSMTSRSPSYFEVVPEHEYQKGMYATCRPTYSNVKTSGVPWTTKDTRTEPCKPGKSGVTDPYFD